MRSKSVQVERQQFVNRAKTILAEIEQIFIDVEYWNDNIRKPHEEPIDPDPDGMLGRLKDGLMKFIECEDGCR